jgi:ribosome production factor 1
VSIPISIDVLWPVQELGPRFTLKLKWLQEGTFDTQFGEYEWIHKRKEMDTSRRRFHL